MPIFTYIGTDESGQKIKKQVEAEDRFAVYEIARKNSHNVETVMEKHRFSFLQGINISAIEIAISRVKGDELVMITRNLGSMLDAGLPLSRALSVVERQSKNPRVQMIMKKIVTDINSGETFHESLAHYPKVFNDLYVSMVRAGEESGGLSESLHTLSVQMQRSTSLKKKIKGAMIYPAIVITILVIIGILMMIYVMPSITGTFKDLEVELPVTTKILIAVSDFMSANTILALGGLIALIVGVITGLRTQAGHVATSWVIPRLPIIGTMAKETNSAHTARTLSSLLSAGVDVIHALDITKDVVQNHFYKKIIAEAAIRVEKGEPMSSVFIERTDLYPILVGEMISVGEETGNIATMMEEMAEFYENEVERKTKDLSTIIEPILMVVIGGTVGFFALAMIAPIYSISDSIG